MPVLLRLGHRTETGLVQGGLSFTHQQNPLHQHCIASPAQQQRLKQKQQWDVQPCKASVREQKDPSSFADMDAAREYLHRKAAAKSYGPIAGVLNWLSNTAFGAGQAGLHLGGFYRQWLQLHTKQDLPLQRGRPAGAGVAAAAAYPETVASLSVLMFMSEHRVQQLVDKYPAVIEMPLGDVAQRLLLLKRLLPSCDVARMIEREPSLLLGCEAAYLTEVVKARLEVLAAGLPGADIAAMVQEDPKVMFEELETSLPRLNELWPSSCLDVHAFAASDPAELALALRALSDKGPPKRF